MNRYDFDLNLGDRNSLSVLIKQVKPNSTVLEFGPANGRMTKYMKEQLNCTVYAVEINEAAAKDASLYTEKIIVDSIENYSWKQEFKNIQFDHIIFADVLEHLYNPEKVLLSVKDCLKMDGSVLVSIPNIAHNAIIINLLKNEFNYSSTGLLDDTHIRFFTKKTFDGLIKKVGLFRSFETAIFINVENTEFFTSYNDLPNEISSFLRNQYYGDAYQFIYELKQQQCSVVSDFSDYHKIYYQYYSQLFLDQGTGISEENSIKLPVTQSKEDQKIIFDLTSKSHVTNLRLDPLNECCEIEIKELKIIRTDDSELDLIPFISANDCSHNEKSYFFETIDPIINFSSINQNIFSDAKKLVTVIRYSYIGHDALTMWIKQTKTELEKAKTELEQIYTSKSYRIMKPLRIIKQILVGN